MLSNKIENGHSGSDWQTGSHICAPVLNIQSRVKLAGPIFLAYFYLSSQIDERKRVRGERERNRERERERERNQQRLNLAKK